MDAIAFAQENITVNTQSSIRLTLDGKIIYADPLSLENAPADADLIFITHDHFDHFSPEDIRKAAKADTVLIVPEKMQKDAQKLGYSVRTAAPGTAFSIDGITVTPIPAYNKIKPFHPRRNGWVGYILSAEGLKIYIAGDTDATDEAAAVTCDIALLPVGGKFTMNPKEAAALVNEMRPAAVIPTHFGGIVGNKKDGETFAKGVDAAIRVIQKMI